MAIQPAGAPEIDLAYDNPPCHYDLRLYGVDAFEVPGWWLGITDSNGQLQRTAFLASDGQSPCELLEWMVPMTGRRAAAELVLLSREAVVRRQRPPASA